MVALDDSECTSLSRNIGANYSTEGTTNGKQFHNGKKNELNEDEDFWETDSPLSIFHQDSMEQVKENS